MFLIKFKIYILDLMLLPKNSVPFEGLYYSSLSYNYMSYICAFAISTSILNVQVKIPTFELRLLEIDANSINNLNKNSNS